MKFRVNNKLKHGFTLIELLVALAVFALLSLAGYQIVDGVRRSAEISRDHSEHLQRLQRAMQLMQQDIIQAQRVTLRDDPQPAVSGLQGKDRLLGSQSQGLQLVRAGVANPEMRHKRSHLLKVGYRVEQGTLQRLSWPVLDGLKNNEPRIQPLLDQVTRLQLRFYADQRWYTQWNDAQRLPQALEVTLDMKSIGQIQRIWLMQGAPVPVSGDGS